MRALVWQQFGQSSVWKAEVPIDFLKIFQEVEAVTTAWDEWFALQDLRQCVRLALNQKDFENGFNRWVRPHLKSHELFEEFKFVTVKE